MVKLKLAVISSMLSGGGVFTHVDQFINRMHNKYNITLFCNSSSDERDKFLK